MPKEISFEIDGDDKLTVTIDTERLQLTSIKSTDLEDYYAKLFSDPDVRTWVENGQIQEYIETEKNVNTWVTRWEMQNPYSSLSVREKGNDEVIGYVLLGPSEPGIAELGYAFAKKNWGKGIATEAVVPVVTDYAPELVKRNYHVHAQPFSKIKATAHPENVGSNNVLIKAGLDFVSYEECNEKYQAPRNHYLKKM